jgi:hypothetical protein
MQDNEQKVTSMSNADKQFIATGRQSAADSSVSNVRTAGQGDPTIGKRTLAESLADGGTASQPTFAPDFRLYRLSHEQSLAIRERVCAEATDITGRRQ